MDKAELARIVSEVEKENSLFANKVHLGTLTFPSKIIGRKDQAKELVSFLATHKQGLVVPFIAVYGRSGRYSKARTFYSVRRFSCRGEGNATEESGVRGIEKIVK